MSARAENATEIHRLIDAGLPNDAIARAVNLKGRGIRKHRSRRCTCERQGLIESTATASTAPKQIISSTPKQIISPPPPPPPPPPVDVSNPVEVATQAYVAGITTLGIATALGIDAYSLDPDSADFGLNGQTVSPRRLERLAARAGAMQQMQRHRPAQWAGLVAKTEEMERQESLDTRLPLEVWVNFWGEVVAHQSSLLTEADMRHWTHWLEDLVRHRYPEMV